MTDTVSSPIWRYRYRLTGADIAAFEALHVDGLMPLLVSVVTIGAVLGWNYQVIEPQLPFEPGGSLQRALLGLGTAFVGYAVARAIDWLRRQRRIAGYRLPMSDTVVDIFGDHVAWTAGDCSDLRPWERVGEIIATPSHVFIFTDPGKALIMPRRAFESATEMAAFAAWLETHIAQWLEMLADKAPHPRPG